MRETGTGAYQVLARKYRPASFDDLIGQEPMVRTLRNAFSAGRIAHAWMLTGVRGVGKTTTARILARGLNFERSDGSGAPSVDLGEEGVHCRPILEGRHPDVLEMDAASHTGIDDIREIIDSARYVPVSARYKVYIVDEVHMLSKPAFNGLLKTLEEPPAHVKFVFATTEIRKVPVTVLSRCQRFDLKRVEADVLIAHLARVCAAEGVEAEAEALRLIVRAAEGSVRDALSLLDQGIAHGGGRLAADTVADMLGLADHARIVDLFEHVMRGDAGAALSALKASHDAGADPLLVLTELAAYTHYVTRCKLAPRAAESAAMSETERVRGRAFAESLSVRVLSRAWQMLLKGLSEVAQAPRPLAAADMVLVRLCHVADLPTPEEALLLLKEGAGGAAAPLGPSAPARPAEPAPAERSAPAAPPAAEPTPRQAEPEKPASPAPETFEDLVALAREKRDRLMVFALERQVEPVRCEKGRLEIALAPGVGAELAPRIAAALGEWTGERWAVVLAKEPAGETLHARRRKDEEALLEEARADPLVASVLKRFPGAEIVGIRDLETTGGSDPAQAEGE